MLTNEVFLESLNATNTYCLHGVENANLSINYREKTQLKSMDFPGLESVVTIFEEVILWPNKFPRIFNQSPLRNQAGILLYGLPGTGEK